MNSILRIRLLSVSAALLQATHAPAQTSQTVTWAGGNSYQSWLGAANWSPQVVPLNSASTNFTAIVGASTSVLFDAPGTGAVSSLNLGADSGLRFATNASLTVQNVAFVGGLLEARVPGARFTADAFGTALGNNARVLVEAGAQVKITGTPGSRYDWTGNYGASPLFSVDGTNSLLNLSDLAQLSVNQYYFDPPKVIQMLNAGRLNLSGLTAITGARTDGQPLRFLVLNGGQLDLPQLRTTEGYVQFDVRLPAFTLPALENAGSTWFAVHTNSTFRAPSLASMSGGPSRLSVNPGGTFEATNLLSMTDTFVELFTNTTVQLPRLNTFANSRLDLAPGRQWNSPPPVNINNARFGVSGGSTFAVAATGYDWTYNYGDTALFTAEGAGSLLDLKSVQRINLNQYYQNPAKTIVAANGGSIDLSGLTTLGGTRTDGQPLIVRRAPGGAIDLASLQTVTGGNVTFRLESGAWTLPLLSAATNTAFELTAGTSLNLPGLTVLAGGNSRFDVPFVATCNVPILRQIRDADVNLEVSGTLNSPGVQTFANSTITLSPGRVWNTGLLTNIDNSSFSLTGSNYLPVAAASYDWTYQFGRTTIFSAEGDGCVLNLASLRRLSLNAYYMNANKDILARLNGRIDLSGCDDLFGGRTDGSPLLVRAESGGLIELGSTLVRSRTSLRSAGETSKLKAASLTLVAPVTLSLTLNGALELNRGLMFSNTAAADISLEAGRVRFVGGGAKTLEVGGLDGGSGGATVGNFAIGLLTVGADAQRAALLLQDFANNGNRVGASPEALYLSGGSQGRSLELPAGSVLVLNGINVYALVSGQMVHLNSLIPPGLNSVTFDEGFLARTGGPRITNMTPSVAVTPAVSSVDFAFDQPIQAASFTTADVSITGPSGVIPATGVSLVSGTTWRINFAAQSADGTYTVRVGPNVNESAGHLPGLDQNGDGFSGDGTNDNFVGTFVIDGTAPLVVGAYALQSGNRVGLTFSEAVVPTFATNPANYSVNGAVPTQAALQATGNQVVLSVSPLVGDTFSLVVNSALDALGNVTNRSYTGTILAMQARDLGTPGADPRDTGSTVPFSEADFNAVGGGSGIWGTSDACQFASEPRVGDFDLRAQITHLDRPGNYAEAGLMVRESLAANSAKLQAIMQLSSSGQRFYLGVRASAGASVTYPTGVVATDGWVRLQRQGSVFTGFRSTNGIDWIEYARLTNSLSVTGHVGMVTCSDDNTAGRAATAWYRDYSDFAPSILTHPQSQSVATGANVTFGVTARGLPTLAYQWQLNGIPLPGETNSLLQLLAVNTNRVGNYRVVVSNPYGSTTSQEATLAVDGVGMSGFEADLSPAPLGNNAVTVSDWVKVGRLVVGLDAPLNSSEFQRADCAPRTNALLGTLPLGDGRLSVADWTQAGRYAAAVDPLTQAGGPTEPASGAPGINGGVLPAGGRTPKDGSVRSVRLVGGKAAQGQSFTVPVELVALGGENALGFSVQFDPARFTYQSVTLGEGATGATLQVNASQADGGAVGVVLAKSFGQAFAAGTAQVARVQFRAVGPTGTQPVDFADTPVWREIADANANVQPAVYLAGAVRVVAPGVLSPDVRVDASGVELRLTGEPGERYRVEVSPDLAQWSPVSSVTAGAGPVVVRDAAGVGAQQRFYRAVLVP